MRGTWTLLTVEQAFGQVLRELRESEDLSQEQFAFEVESGRTYISELERGLRAPTLRWLFRIASRFEITPSEMMRRVEAKVSAASVDA